MEMLSVSLNLHDTMVLVVGGGKVAAHRAERLYHAGAKLTVVSPSNNERMQKFLTNASEVTHQKVSWEQFVSRSPESSYKVVCACTDHPKTNQAIAAFAHQIGAFVNRADDGHSSTLHFAARASVAPVVTTVATGGKAPVVSRALREVLEKQLLPDWAARAREVASIRDRAKQLPQSKKRRFWSSLKQRLIEKSGRDDQFLELSQNLLERLQQ